MGWNRTDASNNSPIMARLWHIIAGIEIYKKKKNNNNRDISKRYTYSYS